MDYMDYYSTPGYSSSLETDAAAAALGAGLGAALGAVMIFAIIFSLIVAVLQIVATWKIFTKAGQAGWKCLIPIYSTVISFRVAGISPWWILGFLASIIPFVGWFVILGINIYYVINLAKSFGRSGAFAAGLFFLPLIFMLILAFGKSEYVGKQEQVASTEPAYSPEPEPEVIEEPVTETSEEEK